MNPAALNFSKKGSLIRIVLMATVCAIVIWLLAAHDVFAPPSPSPPLPPSPTDMTSVEDHHAYLEALRASQPPERHGLDRLTGGWFSIILLMTCFVLAFWEGGMDLWRLLTLSPALQVQNRKLKIHSSFLSAPRAIAVSSIRLVTLDRGDRIRPGFWDDVQAGISWSNRLGFKVGARMRHVLLIDYITTSGGLDSLRITDAQADGGVEQLSRFAAYLRAMLDAESRYT
jgi:hypothetical protein